MHRRLCIYMISIHMCIFPQPLANTDKAFILSRKNNIMYNRMFLFLMLFWHYFLNSNVCHNHHHHFFVIDNTS